MKYIKDDFSKAAMLSIFMKTIRGNLEIASIDLHQQFLSLLI